MSQDVPSESRIGAVALQLARAMELLGDSEPSEDMMRIWMTNLASSSFLPSESKEILCRAAALHRSKIALQPSKDVTIGQSISLWDQFSSFSERVMWIHVQSAKDDDERLALLQKVDHIDDILSDWKEAQHLLQRGLEQCNESYLDLHSKWFGHCQATAEYQTIRLDLCRNILNEARRQFGSTTSIAPTDPMSFSATDERMFKILQTWKSMWIKIITSGGSDEESADSMMLHALVLMRNLSNDEEASLTLLPAHLLALMDPRADWCRCWLEETPVHRILTVLTRSNLLSDLLSRCENKGIVAPSLRHDAEASTFNGSTVKAMQQKFGRVLHRQSLAILSSFLVHLRVLMFPWNQIEANGPPMPRSALLQELWQGDNSGPLFPSQIPFVGDDLLALARLLVVSKDLGDNWLIEQSNLAIDCLSNGCAHDKHTFSRLQEMRASSGIVGSVPLETGTTEKA